MVDILTRDLDAAQKKLEELKQEKENTETRLEELDLVNGQLREKVAELESERANVPLKQETQDDEKPFLASHQAQDQSCRDAEKDARITKSEKSVDEYLRNFQRASAVGNQTRHDELRDDTQSEESSSTEGVEEQEGNKGEEDKRDSGEEENGKQKKEDGNEEEEGEVNEEEKDRIGEAEEDDNETDHEYRRKFKRLRYKRRVVRADDEDEEMFDVEKEKEVEGNKEKDKRKKRSRDEMEEKEGAKNDPSCSQCDRNHRICDPTRPGYACEHCAKNKRKCSFTNIEVRVSKRRRLKKGKLEEGSSKGKGGDKKEEGPKKEKMREENIKAESSKAGEEHLRMARRKLKEVGGMEESMKKMVEMNEVLMEKICGLEKKVGGLQKSMEGLKEVIDELKECVANIGKRN